MMPPASQREVWRFGRIAARPSWGKTNQAASASMTAFGLCAMTFSSTSAGPCGARSPRSQWRSVAVENPKRAANCSCVMLTLARNAFTSTGRGRCTDDLLKVREAKVLEWTAKATRFDAKESELVDRSKKLEDWARALRVFQDRVAQLDKESTKLEARNKEIDAKKQYQKSRHSEQLAELRQQRSELRSTTEELDDREENLKEREKDVKGKELQTIDIKNKNFGLKKEEKRLNSIVDALEREKLQAIAEKARAEKARAADRNRIEINRLNLQIANLSQAANAVSKFSSSITNPTVLAWLLEDGGPEVTSIENGWLGSTGHGPWSDQFLESSLEELKYKFYRLPDADLEYLIVGRKGWSKNDLLAQIESRQGRPLRIYSQEMWFAKIVTGRDPFDADDETLLLAFAADHPALQFLMLSPLPWPEISTPDGPVVVIGPSDFGVAESPLHILGYKVGATSDMTPVQRHQKLTQCFQSTQLDFCAGSNKEYRQNWGRAGSAQRLYRIAIHIKYLADGRVGKDHRKPQSRVDWISDLKWLRATYFSSHSRWFSWP